MIITNACYVMWNVYLHIFYISHITCVTSIHCRQELRSYDVYEAKYKHRQPTEMRWQNFHYRENVYLTINGKSFFSDHHQIFVNYLQMFNYNRV